MRRSPIPGFAANPDAGRPPPLHRAGAGCRPCPAAGQSQDRSAKQQRRGQGPSGPRCRDLTGPSYGRVGADGSTADQDTTGLHPAAPDALHFAAVDRSARTCAVHPARTAVIRRHEPQRRIDCTSLAIRGTSPARDKKKNSASSSPPHTTRSWWPTAESSTTGTNSRCGMRHRHYLNRHRRGATDWDQDLDAITGPVRAAGMWPSDARSRPGLSWRIRDAAGDSATSRRTDQAPRRRHHAAMTQAAHADGSRRDALEQCSPDCANWLRYGSSPRTHGPACGRGCLQRARPTAASTRLRRGPGLVSRNVGQDAGRPRGRPADLLTSALGLPAPTRSATPGNRSSPDDTTTAQRATVAYTSCRRNPMATALDLARAKSKPRPIFRQTGGPHDEPT